MAIELKEALNYLGIPETDIEGLTLASLDERFKKTYTRKDSIDDETAKKITGSAFGKLGTTFKQLMKEKGVDFSSSDIDDKKFEEVLGIGISRLESKYATEMEEIKSKAKTAPNELTQKEIEKLKADLQAEQSKVGTLTQEYDTFKQQSAGALNKLKLDTKLSKIHAETIKWKSDIPEIAKTGLFKLLDDKYSLEVTESDELIVKDKTGNRIANPKINGAFLNYEDVLQEEGVKAGVWAVNQHVQKQNPTPTQQAAALPQGQRPRQAAAPVNMPRAAR